MNKKFSTCSLTCRRISRSDDKNPNWKNKNSKEYNKIRMNMMSRLEYKLWRKAVFERDKYTCQACGKIGGTLNADHIKPWAFFPEYRYELDNGRTLCLPCHKKTYKSTFKFREIKKICLDLDGTICETKKPDESYEEVLPIPGAVEAITGLKNSGLYIIIFTARNMRTYDGNIGKINKYQMPIIESWLKKHNIPYDEILVGKPHVDFVIDDKAIEFDGSWDNVIKRLLKEEKKKRCNEVIRTYFTIDVEANDKFLWQGIWGLYSENHIVKKQYGPGTYWLERLNDTNNVKDGDDIIYDGTYNPKNIIGRLHLDEPKNIEKENIIKIVLKESTLIQEKKTK